MLVLRPEPGASETVRKARERELEPVSVPLFKVGPMAWEAPDPSGFDGLLLTSANALHHGGDQLQSLRGLPVYAVGDATADAARNAGFDIKASGDTGVDRLLGSIAPGLNLLHLCGCERREPSEPHQRVTPVAVYRSRPVAAPDLSRIGGSVALIHSPGAGRRFAELVESRNSIAIAAISAAAAGAAGKGWQSVDIAGSVSDDALLVLAARLCNKTAPK